MPNLVFRHSKLIYACQSKAKTNHQEQKHLIPKSFLVLSLSHFLSIQTKQIDKYFQK